MTQRGRDVRNGLVLGAIGAGEIALLVAYLTGAQHASGRRDYVPLLLGVVGGSCLLFAGILLARAVRNESPTGSPQPSPAEARKDLPLFIGFLLALVGVNVWAILNLN